jgi:SAM-dependent MidA family methyltransferase
MRVDIKKFMLLSNIIIDRIERDGPLSFRDFMEMALYYPGQGIIRPIARNWDDPGIFTPAPT